MMMIIVILLLILVVVIIIIIIISSSSSSSSSGCCCCSSSSSTASRRRGGVVGDEHHDGRELSGKQGNSNNWPLYPEVVHSCLKLLVIMGHWLSRLCFQTQLSSTTAFLRGLPCSGFPTRRQGPEVFGCNGCLF